MQQILLHQKLKEDIEKNSVGRIRYVDSELYLKNNNNHGRSPASNKPELAKLNIKQQQSTSSRIPVTPATTTSTFTATTTSSNNKTQARDDINIVSETTNNYQNDDRLKLKQAITTSTSSSSSKINKNCQVCLIQEVRQDLVNINKIVQERNEQITKLKNKCLRSYFERQMIE